MPQGRHTALTIHLTDEERQTIGAEYARRARLILLIAEGVPLVEVARRVGIARRFVYVWARRLLAEGMEGLVDTPGRGRRLGPRP